MKYNFKARQYAKHYIKTAINLKILNLFLLITNN